MNNDNQSQAPISEVDTPNEIGNTQFKLIKEYKLQLSNNKNNEYKLKLGTLENKVLLKLDCLEMKYPFNFECSYDLDALIKVSKIFKICDSILEAIPVLTDNFDNNKVLLNQEEDSSMSLTFSIHFPGQKQTFKILLQKNNFTKDEVNYLLFEEINDLKSKFKEFAEIKNNDKEEDTKIKNIETNIMNKINNLENQLKDTITKYQEENELIKKQLNDNSESLKNITQKFNEFNDLFKKKGFLMDILNFFHPINIIEKAIKEKNKDFENKSIRFNLIYQATRDGQNCSNCHSKVNNVGHTVSILKTVKGRIFGVYRSLAINGSGPWRQDDYAFIFSLDTSKIYRVKPSQTVVAFDNDCFIQFKNTLKITGNVLTDQYSDQGCSAMNTYFQGFTIDYELNGGESNYNVSEFEVYNVIAN